MQYCFTSLIFDKRIMYWCAVSAITGSMRENEVNELMK
jgi:hypothetical protein